MIKVKQAKVVPKTEETKFCKGNDETNHKSNYISRDERKITESLAFLRKLQFSLKRGMHSA